MIAVGVKEGVESQILPRLVQMVLGMAWIQPLAYPLPAMGALVSGIGSALDFFTHGLHLGIWCPSWELELFKDKFMIVAPSFSWLPGTASHIPSEGATIPENPTAVYSAH